MRCIKFNNNNKAYTLISLVIIIIIIAILFSIATNLYFPSNKLLLQAKAEKLASDIAYVRNYAMNQADAYKITFNSNGYTMSGNNFLHGVNYNNVVAFNNNIVINTQNLPNNYIIFSNYGYPYIDEQHLLTDDAIITLTKNNIIETVTIHAFTGNITLS